MSLCFQEINFMRRSALNGPTGILLYDEPGLAHRGQKLQVRWASVASKGLCVVQTWLKKQTGRASGT